LIIFLRLEQDRERCIKWAKDLDKVLPNIGAYVNSCAKDDTAEDCYNKSLEKMLQIKAKYDPGNLFGKI